MKKLIVLIFTLFFFVACGAQSKPTEASASSDTTALPAGIEVEILPPIIVLDFPLALRNMSNNLFVQNIQSIESIMDLSKEKFELLRQVIEDIILECEGQKTCHIVANNFSVTDHNQSVFLGEIDFTKWMIEDVKYQNTLDLKLNNKEKLIFNWSDGSSEVLTIYQEAYRQVNMHYFIDTFKEKEAFYIEDKQSTFQNTLMISFDVNNEKYKLRSNYVGKNESFSSNILLEKDVLLEENENIYALNSNYSAFDEGSYLLFSSLENLENLNLVELLEKSLGSFLRFENRLEGFSHRSLGDEAVIPFRITADN